MGEISEAKDAKTFFSGPVEADLTNVWLKLVSSTIINCYPWKVDIISFFFYWSVYLQRYFHVVLIFATCLIVQSLGCNPETDIVKSWNSHYYDPATWLNHQFSYLNPLDYFSYVSILRGLTIVNSNYMSIICNTLFSTGTFTTCFTHEAWFSTAPRLVKLV